MLRNILFTLLILTVGNCYAQQDYFVLIRTENNQPFYVRMQDKAQEKTLSSTSKGRLILSQLSVGNHTISIGFPKQAFPEQQFSFDIGTKDIELQLKDLGERGWGLYNPQTQELKTAEKKAEPVNAHNEGGVKKDDAFSRLMAGVVSDTAVMYNTYAAPIDSSTLKVQVAAAHDSSASKIVAAPIPTTAVPPTEAVPVPQTVPVTTTVPTNQTVRTSAVPTDTLSATNPPNANATSTATPPVPTPATIVSSSTTTTSAGASASSSPAVIPSRTLSTVIKLSERKTPKGFRIAFSDRQKDRKADTVIIYIPMDSSSSAARVTAGLPPADTTHTSKSAPPPTVEVSEYHSDTLHLYAVPKKTNHQKTDSSHTRTAGELYRPKADSVQRHTETKPQVVNSDCRNFASDYDVDKLRVKMLEISKDDDRITAAKKIFKTKCFTTNQIKALSEVFTTDAAKYRFFESAYPFVSDDHFRELTDLLADPVYNGKFRVMTGQQ